MPISDTNDCRNSENKEVFVDWDNEEPSHKKEKIEMDCRRKLKLRCKRPRGSLSNENTNTEIRIYLE